MGIDEKQSAEIMGAVERLRVPFGVLFVRWMLDEIERGTEPAAIVVAFTGSVAAATSTIIEQLLRPEGHAVAAEMAANMFRLDVISMTAAPQEQPEEPKVH